MIKDAVIVAKFELDDDDPREKINQIIRAISNQLGSDIQFQLWAGTDDAARKVLEQTLL